MVQYKLTYFNGRGRAEFIRYIFAQAGIEYENDLIDFVAEGEWDKRKLEMPMGQVPVLNVDGTLLAQCTAIGDYLGRKFSLAGHTEMEASRCLMLAEGCSDAMLKMVPYVVAMLRLQDKDKAQEAYQKAKPGLQTYFGYFEALLKQNGTDWFVGDTVTWADLMIAEYNQRLIECVDPNIMDGYDALKQHAWRVHQLAPIKKRCGQRTPSPF